MDLSHIEWVDNIEWAALEEAMAAAVQQQTASRSNRPANFQPALANGQSPSVGTGVQRAADEGVKPGTGGAKKPAVLVPCKLQGHVAASGTYQTASRGVVEHLFGGSSQQVSREVMSLSDWVPSQQGFPGFWQERPTAGAESVTAGEGCALASAVHIETRAEGESGNARQEPEEVLRSKQKLSGLGNCGTKLIEGASPVNQSALKDALLANTCTMAVPDSSSSAHSLQPKPPTPADDTPNQSEPAEPPQQKQGELRRDRQLPSWLTSAKAATHPQECTLPVMRFGGRIVYAMSPQEVECCARTLLEDLRGREACLGFDIEWKVTFRRGEAPQKAALIQLCPSGACCYLFHIAHSGLTSALRGLLEEPSIAKAGAGIYGDAQKLRRDFGVSMGGLQDLSELANERLQPKDGPRKWSLTALAQEAMLQQVEKPPKQRISDWERLPLSPDQRQYAATDAYASLRLYQVLMSLPAPSPRPILRPLPQSELNSLGCPVKSPRAESTSELWVSAIPEPSYLAPSKAEVHRLHLDGLTIEQISVKKGIRVATVEGYLVEAMQAGLGYAWHRMGVSDAVRERVEGAVRAGLDTVECRGDDLEACRGAHGLSESGLKLTGGQSSRVGHGVSGSRCRGSESPSHSSLLEGTAINLTAGNAAAERSAVGSGFNKDVESCPSVRTTRGGLDSPVGAASLTLCREIKGGGFGESKMVTNNQADQTASTSEGRAGSPLSVDGAGQVTSADPKVAFEPPGGMGTNPVDCGASGHSVGLRVTSAGELTADRISGLRLKALMDRIPPEATVTFSQVRIVVAHLARQADEGARQQKRMRLLESCYESSITRPETLTDGEPP